MVVDSLLRDDETVCDLRVRRAVGEQSEHLELPARQPAGVLLRRRPWAPRHTRSLLAKLPGDRLSSRPCAEPGELIERLSLTGLFVVLAKRDRPLVRTARRLPGGGCLAPLATQLMEVRPRRHVRDRFFDARALPPPAELGDRPRRPVPCCELESLLSRVSDQLGLAL